jgi:hypothetical protein
MAREGFVSPGAIPEETPPEEEKTTIIFHPLSGSTMKEQESWQRR